MHCIVDVPRRQGIVYKNRQVLNAPFQQALQPRADHAEGQIEHQRHDAHKRRNRRIFSSEEAVDPCAAQLLLALVGLYHSLIHQLVDKVEPHICNGGGAVQAALLLHLQDDMLDHLFFVLIQLQGLLNAGVALHQLCGSKAHRDPRRPGVVLDEMDDAVDAAVNGTAVVILAAEVHPARTLLILCHMDGVIHQLVHALVLGGGNGDHRDAQHRFHLVDVDGAAVAAHLIHHIQCQHHGGVQLHQLHR